ncbi:restriction endonuclease subunit S [Aeromonas veronii]|uniref:restriction endonuclease subunit S n=1 Tax=Aeromonas veronii TaxID=654 RepID=UPI003D1B54F5
MAEQMMQDKASGMAATQTIPKGYKQTEVGVIPEDWDVLPLASICREIGDGIHTTPTYSLNGDYFFINGNNIKNGNVVYDENVKRVDEAEYQKHSKTLTSKTLFLSINGTIGNLARYKAERLVLGKSVAYLTIKDSDSVIFSYYALQTEKTKKFFEDGLTGSTIKNLGLSTIRNTMIPVPSYEEQTAIANVLSDSDALIGALEQLIAKKQAIKTAAMQQLLTGRTRLPQFALRSDGTPKGYKTSELGQIPEDWKVLPLGELCHFENGDRSSNYPSSDEFVSFGIPFINAGHIDNGVIDSKGMDYISAVIYARLGGGKVKPGDLVYCLRGSLGKFGVVPDDFGMGAIASSLVIVRPITSRTSCEFISEYFKSDISKRMVSLWAGGAAQPNLGAKELANFLVPLPNNLEQTAIATILSDMDSELTALEQKLAKARDVKQGMMQQLLTGRIRLPVEQIE